LGELTSVPFCLSVEPERDGAAEGPFAAPGGQGCDRECARRRGVGTAHAAGPAPFVTDDAVGVGRASRDAALATAGRARRLR
jgi:hypothetical protein